MSTGAGLLGAIDTVFFAVTAYFYRYWKLGSKLFSNRILPECKHNYWPTLFD